MESILKVRSALVAFGGNQMSEIGAPAAVLAAALAKLAAGPVRLSAISRFYRTPAFPVGSGPDFVNGALRLTTTLDPAALLALLHGVEADFGRLRRERWGPRILDLDLLAVEDMVLPDAGTVQAWIDLPPGDQTKDAPDRLLLPHPRLQDRAFVLIPLAEIAAGWCHPLTGQSVADMLMALPEAAKAGIWPL